MPPHAELPSPVKASTSRNRLGKHFQTTVSPLDPADPRSSAYSSDLRGFYNLGLICGGLYTATTVLSSVIAREEAVDLALFRSVFYSGKLLEVFVAVGCQALYAYTALIPVYMAGTELFSGRLLMNMVHHTLQSLLFFFTVVCIVWRDWNLIHAVSAFIEGLVLLMKMHSYIRTKLESAWREGEAPSLDFKAYTIFLLTPSLVYEPGVPRTKRIRWGYVVEKVFSTVLAIATLYIIVVTHIQPRLEEAGTENPILSVMNLLFPFLTCYLITWFIIFECICNGFAEVTFFADREFYSDWWNSSTFDEFARKWNKPVHEFLRRHVYLDVQQCYHVSKRNATLLTFSLSSILHECVFVIIFHTVKMYFFTLQMGQIVIIFYGRGLHGTRLGNIIFWLGLIVSLPLETIIYCREYHGGESIFAAIMMPVIVIGFSGICVASFIRVKQSHRKVL